MIVKESNTTEITTPNSQITFRIGQGYDVHRFVAGRKLILGGVEIPYDKGMLAHSDGDVVLHAICDALLGAAGLGDIGQHFPDTASEFKAIDSRILLKRVFALLNEKKIVVSNIDVTILAEQPKLQPYKEKMQHNIANDLQLHFSQVNIKATTNEGIGFIGQGEGIAVFVVALLTLKS